MTSVLLGCFHRTGNRFGHHTCLAQAYYVENYYVKEIRISEISAKLPRLESQQCSVRLLLSPQ